MVRVVALAGTDLLDRGESPRALLVERPAAVAVTTRPAEPLSVLTFLNSFAPGGVERVAARLHAAWCAAGVDARIVLADGQHAPAFPLAATSALAVSAHKRSLLGSSLTLLRGLPRLIAAERPDILFCAGNTYTAVAVALKLLLGRRCPVIVAKISNDLVRRDMPWPLRRGYRAWLKLQGRHIDHFVAMAPPIADEIARLVGVPAARVSVIEDPAVSAADLVRLAAARDAAVRPSSGRHYLAIGRLAPQKNFTLLLDAFARIAAPDDTLTIVGEGPERAALHAQAARLGITQALAMPGHVDPLDHWLATADVLVMSSTYEGVPAVIIEGLAAGIPIAATNCGVSMAGLLGHDRFGTLAPVGDADALGAAMLHATHTPESRAAARAAAAHFTVETASRHYLALFRTLAVIGALPESARGAG